MILILKPSIRLNIMFNLIEKKKILVDNHCTLNLMRGEKIQSISFTESRNP